MNQLQVNLNIDAGTDFTKQFSVKNDDQTAKDLTGYTFTARLAKHSRAMDADGSTSAAPVWRFVDFTTTIDNATGGLYSISLASTNTVKLEEGKYVYNIVMSDASDNHTSIVEGLVFVDVAFGYTGTYGSLDSNYP